VEAVNSQVCWVAGSNATVLRTTDGGSSWLNANPNPGVITGNITNIEAIDENTAWVATTQAINTFIYKTVNGGVSWQQVFSRQGGYVFGIHMSTQSSGMAFGDPISNIWQLLVTTNGGDSWSVMPTSPASAGPASQGTKNCFQVSLPYIWFGSYPGQVLRSSDSGLNWTLHTTPGMATILSIHFNSPSLGFASSINMASSTDAGTTYQQHSVLGMGNINAVEGAGSDVWYIRGEKIYRSTNSGLDWAVEHTASVTQLDLDLPDNQAGCQTGWAVGHAGSVIKLSVSPLGNGNNTSVPATFMLQQNFPNPFNPQTEISYSIAETANALLKVTDITGQEVEILANGVHQPGHYSVRFDATGVGSGIYFYTLIAGSFSETKKMIVTK
jgi:photosystem II stability/assembly factor-like uncharacterized protein